MRSLTRSSTWETGFSVGFMVVWSRIGAKHANFGICFVISFTLNSLLFTEWPVYLRLEKLPMKTEIWRLIDWFSFVRIGKTNTFSATGLEYARLSILN